MRVLIAICCGSILALAAYKFSNVEPSAIFVTGFIAGLLRFQPDRQIGIVFIMLAIIPLLIAILFSLISPYPSDFIKITHLNLLPNILALALTLDSQLSMRITMNVGATYGFIIVGIVSFVWGSISNEENSSNA